MFIKMDGTNDDSKLVVRTTSTSINPYLKDSFWTILGELIDCDLQEEVVPVVDSIVFNPEKRTTVVFWDDDSKTIVKCTEGDVFDKRIGFAMAYMNKIFGSRQAFVKYVSKNPYVDEIQYAFSFLLDVVFDSIEELDKLIASATTHYRVEE